MVPKASSNAPPTRDSREVQRSPLGLVGFGQRLRETRVKPYRDMGAAQLGRSLSQRIGERWLPGVLSLGHGVTFQ